MISESIRYIGPSRTQSSQASCPSGLACFVRKCEDYGLKVTKSVSRKTPKFATKRHKRNKTRSIQSFGTFVPYCGSRVAVAYLDDCPSRGHRPILPFRLQRLA